LPRLDIAGSCCDNLDMPSFSELTGKQRTTELLRWVFLAPTAMLTVVAPHIVASVVMPRPVAQPPGYPPMPVSDFQRHVLPWVFSVFIGMLFVVVGAKMAPRYRAPTANVLAVVWILYSLSRLAVHFGRGGYNPLHNWHFAVAVGGSLIGAAYIYFSERAKCRPASTV
jgi:hypothetical protein